MSLATEFRRRTSILPNASFDEITGRLIALLDWMAEVPEINSILGDLQASGRGVSLLQESSKTRMAPQAATIEDVAAVGLTLIVSCKAQNAKLFQMAIGCGINPGYSSSKVAGYSDAAYERYIVPFLDYVFQHLPEEGENDPPSKSPPAERLPAAIQESHERFRSDYPELNEVGFVMMQFSATTAHEAIERAIKTTLNKHGMRGLLARDKEYHEELYPNIQTFMHGCGFGIAVFERIQSDDFNPNVSLEVGYMLGLKKPVLLLKDQTLHALQTDLVGRLYRPFDPQNPGATIPKQIEAWLEDKNLI